MSYKNVYYLEAAAAEAVLVVVEVVEGRTFSAYDQSSAAILIFVVFEFRYSLWLLCLKILRKVKLLIFFLFKILGEQNVFFFSVFFNLFPADLKV